MTPGRLRATAVMLTAALATAACGQGSGGDGPEPIRIATIATLESQQFSAPQVRTAVEVAVREINDAGGIGGRPIEPTFCNDKFDPNEAGTCAREAISDGAVAVVGGTTPNAPSILPLLEEAGLPWLAGSGTSGPAELRSPISYPINAGAPGMGIGAGARAVALGGPNVVVMAGENEGSQAGGQQAALGVTTAGGTVRTIVVPLNAPDFSAQAANALTGGMPDAVSVAVTPEDAVKVVQALHQAGYTGPVTAPSSLFPPTSIAALGPAAEGITVMSRLTPTTSTSVPQVKQFVDQMTAADPDVRIDDLGLNAWTGVHLLAELLKDRPVEDSRTVLDALGSISAPIELGTVPAYPGVRTPAPEPDYPRVAVFETIEAKVVDGRLVQQGDFFDPLKPAA